METTNTLTFTPELAEEYLTSLTERGRKQETVLNYRRILGHFYEFLPEEKQIDAGSVVEWREHLAEAGYAACTVNVYLSAVNSFLQYTGRSDMKQPHVAADEENIQPELSRMEYLRLLDAAKRLGKERIYLIIKTLGSLGMMLQELHLVTVESVREGEVVCRPNSEMRRVFIPIPLQRELLEYIAREEIERGCIFVTANGTPMERKHIWSDMQRLCEEAGVPEGKVNARCLVKMYKSTCREIREQMDALATQAYERLLEQEQIAIGWKL